MPLLKTRTRNLDGSNTVKEVQFKESLTTDTRGWIYQSINVMVHRSHPKIEVMLDGYCEAIDELWIHPANSIIYDKNSKKPNSIICNNFDL